MLQQFKCNECGTKWCSIKRVTKLAVAIVSYPSRIPAILVTPMDYAFGLTTREL